MTRETAIEQAITPELLIRDDWREINNYTVDKDSWLEFLYMNIQVDFKNGVLFSVMIRTRHSSYDTVCKGVDSMPKLIALTELVLGEKYIENAIISQPLTTATHD